MTITPVSYIHGDTIRFHRDLYTALKKMGLSYPEIKAISVSQALLYYFGSSEAVDANMGEGTYRGVKQRLGGLGSWRKQWKRATAEHEDEYKAQCAALDHLRESARHCQQLGVMEQDILVAFHSALTTPARVVPFNPPQQLPQAQ